MVSTKQQTDKANNELVNIVVPVAKETYIFLYKQLKES